MRWRAGYAIGGARGTMSAADHMDEYASMDTYAIKLAFVTAAQRIIAGAPSQRVGRKGTY